MTENTFYRDHWVEVDDQRLDAYESMFAWHPRMSPLLNNADIDSGHSVLDFGCGPGGLAMELARRVGADGKVVGVDLNEQMIKRALVHADDEGVSSYVNFLHHSEDVLPFADASFDRVVCKSVLEYVTSPKAMLSEFSRVTAPGGRVHVVDSDWGMIVIEPLDDDEVAEVFAAAQMAYRTPHIGRRLFGLFANAGLQDLQVQILSAADTTGVRAPIARNMLSYAVDSGGLAPERAEALGQKLQSGIDTGRYLLVLPQFVVTGTVP